MASFRRTSSMPPPTTHPRDSAIHEEANAAAASSPLTKSLSSSSSNNSDHHQPFIGSLFPRSFGSLDYTLYKVQTLVLGCFPKRSSSGRHFERLKSKGNLWRKALFHFLIWFLLGMFIGFTPFAIQFFHEFPHQKSSFLFREVDGIPNHTQIKMASKPKDGNHSNHGILVNPLSNQSSDHQDSSLSIFHKLLIIVTPIYGLPFEAYYINRLANTLKLVMPPLLWMVVEMGSPSLDIAEQLRNSGVMFRHLVCKDNLVDMNIDRGTHLRNVVLSHIETHKLNGIIYFANYDNIYTTDLFDQMRQIRRFRTWAVAKVEKEETEVMMEGPICNGSKVIGWHTKDMTNKLKRFHAGISGFAFNSTILWDPKRWHGPKIQPIRFLHTVKEVFQVGMFIEQIVEDESQMEGFPMDCSRIMVWHFNVESLHSFLPRKSSSLPYWLNGA